MQTANCSTWNNWLFTNRGHLSIFAKKPLNQIKFELLLLWKYRHFFRLYTHFSTKKTGAIKHDKL